MKQFIIGVDVGTGSARAALFTPEGEMLSSAVCPIQMWHPKPDYAEQSSDDIWRAVCQAVNECREKAKVEAQDVRGISFDATCSLVVLDAQNQPLAVNDEGDKARNVIVWMDHRALAETEEINAGGYDVLRYVGGQLSPEMEVPKLLWLKRHLGQIWAQAEKFLDLADFLTYRASGLDARSLCTVVCKWTYLGHEARWDESFFKSVGLEDVFPARVSSDVRPMGENLGPLTDGAARELGLTPQCRVGVGIIDAHAGGLGLLGTAIQGDGAGLENALALIGGTSNCHMAVSREPRFIEGVWGPYFGVMVPQMWLNEGGQSTAGSAIDFAVANHAGAPALNELARQSGHTVYEVLNEEVARLQKASGCGPELTKNLHVLPDFLGNRSPHADPHARGLIDGLPLDTSLASHALLYYATIQAVAYGTRDIVAAMNEAGYHIQTLLVTGGGTKNPLWLQEHADATGCTLILPREPEAVLLGSAMLASVAAGVHPDLPTAMARMSHIGQTIQPRGETKAYHAAKFEVFRGLYEQQKARRAAMGAF